MNSMSARTSIIVALILVVEFCCCSLSGKRGSPENPPNNTVNGTQKEASSAPIITPTPMHFREITGSFRVVGVQDGDTITVLDDNRNQTKIRLAGIDAPETGTDFSKASKQNLEALIFEKNVTLEGTKVDRYGRRIAKVLFGQLDINLEQIRVGLAWHYKKYTSEQSAQDQRLYSSEEDEARKKGMGLWSLKNPKPPWDQRSKRDR